MTELYLFRHGIAEERGAKPDADRRLTDEGRDKTRRAAEGMRALKLAWDEILSSPYIRAWETAEIAASVCKHRKPLVRCEPLASGFEIPVVLEHIARSHADAESLLLVGHEPDFSELLSTLISGSPDCGINFKKAGLACVSVSEWSSEARGELQWMLTPRQLRKLVE